jgi:hypothetical protein
MNKIQTVHAFMDAITDRDLDRYRELCAPGYVLWHSYNQVEMDIERSMAALQMMVDVMPEIEYVDRDIFEAPRDSVIAQYICRGSTIADEPVALHVMLRIFFDDAGLLLRIEEYVDSGECMVIRRAGEKRAAA